MEEIKNSNNIIESVKATMKIEGMELNTELENLMFKYLNDEISSEQGIEYIKSKFI